ncbi:Oidioi.mRNA.OKI2018_I69.PAR.g12308.t1.cds [Oikopleura dioica]|uniref:Oidioi.mRNA.OKI2018_I69.PAR.g12308.t1.cds n=1 Tax=Oikopleura dioica TaxID=34765 RepID=A0ABN7RZE6_OIKDI|nr:Oidioi.mRNA.OKI2018_I69.PAR.g12308.t1.cds [Oikopleura dioica]
MGTLSPFLAFRLLALSRAAIDNAEFVSEKANKYEIKIQGNFKGGSSSFNLVPVDADSERFIPCHYEGGLIQPAGLILPTKRERAWAVQRGMTHTIDAPERFKTEITCYAYLPEGSYYVAQGRDICRDEENCLLIAGSYEDTDYSKISRNSGPVFNSINPDRVSVHGGGILSIQGSGFGTNAAYSFEGDEGGTGYKVIFIPRNGQEVKEGILIEHKHRDNLMEVEVPEWEGREAADTDVELYYLSNGAYEKVGTKLLRRYNDRTPIVNWMSVNAMNPFRSSYWTSWRSLSSGVNDDEWAGNRYFQDFLLGEGDMCQSPIGIQARRVDTGELAQKTDQVFRHYNPYVGFQCVGEDQHSSEESQFNCLDYEVRYFCDKGVQINGQLYTGRYGEEVESGNRLRGPALLNNEYGYSYANCDYAWRDPDTDELHKSYATDSVAVCNIGTKNPNAAIGNQRFRTVTYDQGRGGVRTAGYFMGPSPDYKLFDFTIHGGINSVTPASGGAGGGQLITVQGDGLSNTTKVNLGNQECAFNSFNDETGEFVCTTPSVDSCASMGSWFPGARGLTAEWTNSAMNPGDNSWRNWETSVTDIKQYVIESSMQSYVDGKSMFSGMTLSQSTHRFTGYFVPPFSGWFTFTGSADDKITIYFDGVAEGSSSCGSDHSNMEELFRGSCCAGTDYNNGNYKKSKKIELTAGEKYPIEIIYSNHGSGGYFFAGFVYHGTNEAYNLEETAGDIPYPKGDFGSCMDERQDIRLISHEQRENIAVKVEGDSTTEFNLQWCNDAGICKVSRKAMKGDSSASAYRSSVQDLLDSHIETSGSFDPVYEVDGDSSAHGPAFEGGFMYNWRNGWQIMNNKDLNLQRDATDICMAYKASTQGVIRLHLSNVKSERLFDPEIALSEQDPRRSFTFDYDMAPPNGVDWTFFCQEIYTSVYTKLNDEDLMNKINPDIRLHAVELRGDSWFKVDFFKVGNDNSFSVTSREEAINPNIWITQLRKESKTDGVFNVEMIESNCGYEFNDFEIVSLAGLEVTSSSTSVVNVDGLTVPATVYTVNGVTTVTVYENKKVSPGVTGYYELDYGPLGKAEFDVTLDANGFKNIFSSAFGQTFSWIKKSGDCNTGFKYDFRFNGCDDIPTPVAVNTGLSRPELVPTVTDHRDGGIFFQSIPGNYFRQRTKTPKLSAFNTELSIPYSCEGTGCDFVYADPADAPTISSINPATFNGATTFILSGENLDTANLEIFIGHVKCTLSSVVTSSATCDISDLSLPGGNVPLYVSSTTFGKVRTATSLVVNPEVTSVLPVGGSELGGQLITIDGVGLGGLDSVEMNGVACEVIDTIGTSVIIRSVAGANPVTFTINSWGSEPYNFESTGYMYAAPATLSDNSGIIGILSVAGGQTMSVFIGGTNDVGTDFVAIISGSEENDIEIIDTVAVGEFYDFITPVKAAGIYNIQLRSDIFGLTEAIPATYRFALESASSEWDNDNASPAGLGNLKITVAAGGLAGATVDNLAVKLGVKDCIVESVGITEFECVMPSYLDAYDVTLELDTASWSPQNIEVHQYAKITWLWGFSLADGTVPTFQMREIDAATGFDVPGGFSTEAVQSNLGLVSLFASMAPGTYSYSSGFVDGFAGTAEFRGTITVLPPKKLVLPVTVTLAGQEATTGLTQRKKDRKKFKKLQNQQDKANQERMIRCDPTPYVDPINGAADVTLIDTSEATKLSFVLCPGWAPTLTSIVQTDTTISVDYSPVVAGECANNYEVVQTSPSCVDQLSYTVVGTNVDNLDIEVAHSLPHPIGSSVEFNVVQAGRGAAFKTTATKITLEPSINTVNLDDMSQNRFLSPKGGSKIVVKGSGFVSSRTIAVTANICEVISVDCNDATDCTIECVANPSSNGDSRELELTWELSACTGQATSYTLSSGYEFVTNDEVSISVDAANVDFATETGMASIQFSCTLNCALLEMGFSSGDFDIDLKQGESTIALSDVAFNKIDNTFILTFTAADYAPGAVQFSLVSYYQHGTIVSVDDTAVAAALERSLPVASFDACYQDVNCLTSGYSIYGGSTATVVFSDEIPEDLQISIMEGQNELCLDGCGLEFAAGTYQATFVVPASVVAADSSAKLGFAVNGGQFVYASAYEVVYSVAATPQIDTLTPSKASYAGMDTITITGSGFVNADESVIGSRSQQKTSENEKSLLDYIRKKKKKKKPLPQLGFYEEMTAGARSLGCAHLTVKIGEADAVVNACSATEIVADLPFAAAGTQALTVVVDQVGRALDNVNQAFNFDFEVVDIQPTSGSLGGGTRLTVIGSGLSNNIEVLVCGKPCTNFDQTALKAGLIICDVPKPDEGTTTCSVTVNEMVRGRKGRNTFNFNFSADQTPTVTAISKTKGGTAGGTELNISGTGFSGSNDLASMVTIVNPSDPNNENTPECLITDLTDTQIICTTQASALGSFKGVVTVYIEGKGNAQADESLVQFWYIDRYSSTYTWGCTDGSCKPVAGDIVVVSTGQTLLLDESTELLAVLLIDGGTLIWDRQSGIKLQAEYIIVTKDGHFEIGTEEDPFCLDDDGNRMTAEMVLFGHHRSIRLPIYGAKVMAVRSGTVDMHGCDVITWTQLAQTANAGDNVIKLEADIRQGAAGGWHVGDHIVVATTGPRLTMTQSEHVEIAAISADGTEITLNRTLNYMHLGVESFWEGANGQVKLEQKAEVGLLTRNIKFRGHNNEEWIEDLPECENEFDSAQTSIQNCFLNKFNDEVGNDKFGAHLMFHKPTYGKVEYVEFSHTGQGFHLGRYSLHFHMSLHQPNSYFRGLGVHHTFNRAMTIHGTHDALFEWNVAYRCEGHNFFIEDGWEQNNTIQYNLGIFARPSSSMLNTDQSATTFWVTNTNNRVRHNHAAGAAFFGFWINPPSSHHHAGEQWFQDSGYAKCPDSQPVLEFRNNTAHSVGEYGFWIFLEYRPRAEDCGGTRGGDRQHNFEDVVGWHNKRGFEIASAGNGVRVKNGVFSDNSISNFAFMESRDELFGDLSYGMQDGISIGYSGAHESLNDCTSIGLETPWMVGSTDVDGIRFFNFDHSKCKGIDACYASDFEDCGFTAEFRRVQWNNSPNRFRAKWRHVTILHDTDGTLSAPLNSEGSGGDGWPQRMLGQPGAKVVASASNYDPGCTSDASFSRGADSSICPPATAFHRLGLNNMPAVFSGTQMNMTSIYGEERGNFQKCRSTHGGGWMVLLPTGVENYVHWVGLGHVNNISYSANMYDVGETKEVWLSHEVQRVDYVTGLGEEMDRLPQAGDGNKKYYYGNDTLTVPGAHKGRLAMMFDRADCIAGSENSGTPDKYCDNSFNMKMYKCFWENCIPPPTDPPPVNPDQTTCRWSVPECWEDGIPEPGSNVTITGSTHMLIDIPDVDVDLIFVEGALEFDQLAGKDFTITARQILTNTGGGNFTDMIGRSFGTVENMKYSKGIEGRNTYFMSQSAFKVGTAENPWPCDGSVQISLTGDKWSTEVGSPEAAIVIGAKAIAVLGGLEMHGCPRNFTKTYLKNFILPGYREIRTTDATGWNVGDRIFIAPTSFDPREAEEFFIQAIDGNLITLDHQVEFRHAGVDETRTLKYGSDTHFGAEIGLLSHNIVIDGHSDSEDIFGGRVVVMRSAEANTGALRYGWAQIQNVEFRGMGQFGYQEEDDQRVPVFLWGLQDASVADSIYNIQPSYVKDSSFHHCYNGGIATRFTTNYEISGNVMYDMLGGNHIMNLDSPVGSTITNNLISKIQFHAIYPATAEFYKYEEDTEPAGFFITATRDIVFDGNTVAGGDGNGFVTQFDACDATELCSYENSGSAMGHNTAHTTLRGVHWNNNGPGDCVKIANFTSWRNMHHCVWVQASSGVVVENVLCVDNWSALWSWKIGPSPVGHGMDNQPSTFRNFIIDQFSDTLTCNDYIIREATQNYKETKNSRTPGTRTQGTYGIMVPQFASSGMKWPGKPLGVAEAYASLYGGSCFMDIQLMNFGEKCGRDFYGIGTSSRWSEHQHMMELQFVTFDGPSTHRYQFSRPNLGWISIADCVDMDCDGLKRSMLVDLTGDFLGMPSTYIMAQSEYHYEKWVEESPHYYQGTSDLEGNEDWPQSDERRGLGDFRIPKTMVTTLDGHRIPFPEYAPLKGTIRNDQCTWNPDADGYECPMGNFAQLGFESFDHDSSTRRVAPIGLRDNERKRIDLSNGVMDVSCCFGYACLLRVTMNFFNLECGHTYQYHTSGTLPKHTRFHMFGTKSVPQAECKIRIELFTFRQNRQMIYLNGEYQRSNQQYTTPDGGEAWHFPTDDLKPELTEPAGANYFQRMEQVVYFNMEPGTYVDVKISDTILLELDVVMELTIDEFWDHTELPRLLAVMLGIHESKIKMMNVIAEDSDPQRRRRSPYNRYENPTFDRRRRQSGNMFTVLLEAGSGVCNPNCPGVRVTDERLEAIEIGNTLLAKLATGELDALTNTTTESVGISIPEKDAEAPSWFDPETNESNYTIATVLGLEGNATLQEVEAAQFNLTGETLDDLPTFVDTQEVIEEALAAGAEVITYTASDLPDNITIASFPEEIVIGEPVYPPIVLHAYRQGVRMERPIGLLADPWTVNATAVLRTRTLSLSGDTTCAFDALGNCTFYNLIFDQVAENVGLNFQVISPASAIGVVADPPVSDPFVVIDPTGQSTPAPETTTEPTTTTETSTVFMPKDISCSLKKGKTLGCSKRNMHTGENLVKLIMAMTPKQRKNVKQLDISGNPALPIETLKSILTYLPGLTTLDASYGRWTVIPSDMFKFNTKLKTLDISNNKIQCIRGALSGLKMKSMKFANNDMLVEVAGGKTKSKKGKLAKLIKEWNKMDKGLCFYYN